MTYPIHDWKDKSKYPKDPLMQAPKKFLARRRGMKKSDIRAIIWHWEFLRRHKQYQDNWQEVEGETFLLVFKAGFLPGPDPMIDYPLNLIFTYENTKKDMSRATFIDLHQSWDENQKRLKLEYDLFRASKSLFELAMLAASLKPKQRPPGNRLRKPSEKKFPTLLRILDAVAAGEKPALIPKKT